jgi:hypothetical protein
MTDRQTDQHMNCCVMSQTVPFSAQELRSEKLSFVNHAVNSHLEFLHFFV